MKNVKRVVMLFISLMMFFNTLIVYAADMKLTYQWPYGATVSTVGNINEGYGVYIKLIKYDKDSGRKETIVGVPILLYTGSLLESITEIDSSATGASTGGSSSSSSNVSFCVASNTSNCPSSGWTHFVKKTADIPSPRENQTVVEGSMSGDRGYAIVSTPLSSVNPSWKDAGSCTKSTSNTYGTEQVSYYKDKDIWYLLEGSTDDSNISSNINNYITKNVTVIRDVNLPSNNMYNYIKTYILGSNPNVYNNASNILRDNNGKGKVTIAKLMSAFKINSTNFNIAELDSYYLAFEPVVRKKTDVVVKSWTTKTTKSGTSGTASWNWTCSADGSTTTSSSTPSASCEKPGRDYCYCPRKNQYSCPCNSPGGVSGAGTGSCKCCTAMKCESTTVSGTWEKGTCASYKYNWKSTLITEHKEKVSVIQPARYNNNTLITSTLRTSIGQDESEHCVKSKDNIQECASPRINEYYIGPTLKTALVGTTNDNKYQLYNGTQSDTKESAKKNAVGVSYWWLPDLTSCKKECPQGNGDGLLKCAENYCDNYIGYDERENTQKMKADCMQSLCGYKYEPVSCSTSNPYDPNEGSDFSTVPRTTCGYLDGTESLSIDNGRVKVTCVSDDTDIFDQKTYINIACKETTGVGFTDLSTTKVLAGQGINYYVNQKGNKECTVFFDLNTWKFAYASYHSEDKIIVNGREISTRQQLINMLNYFNGAVDREVTSAIGIELSGEDYATTWQDIGYNRKLKITTKVTEIVNNVKKISEQYLLIPTYEENNSKLDVIENQSTKAFYSLNEKTLKVNKYLQTSDKIATYTFEKHCVSNDGKALVYKSPSSGVCYQDLRGESILGKNVYYTDLNATANTEFKNPSFEHSFSTKVYFDDDNIQLNDESCPYEIGEDELSCTIDIEANEGTVMHGNDVYVNGNVTAILMVKDRLGVEDYVESKSISDGRTAGEEKITVGISDQKKGNEKVKITGTLITRSGKKVTCNKEIHFINPDPTCGVSCSIDKKAASDDLYQIRSTGRQTPRAYLSATSLNFKFVRLSPDVRDNLYYVRVKKDKMTQYVYGKVQGTTTSGATCYNLCWFKVDGDCDNPEDPACKRTSCTEKTDPADISSVKSYCTKYWDVDINNYTSVTDCETRCSRKACPSNVRDLDTVKEYCKSNYDTLGYSNASNCVNYCYYCPECSSDYIYRTVSNYNPFPYSKDSNTLGFHYPTGKRIIGSNWIDKSQYIKMDDEDTTSVTGTHAHQNVEYVIDLTPDDIRKIRQDTESYNGGSVGNDAYLDYVYQDGTDKTKRYYSKFINDTFRNNFTILGGDRIR